jgi:hypothetical protein
MPRFPAPLTRRLAGIALLKGRIRGGRFARGLRRLIQATLQLVHLLLKLLKLTLQGMQFGILGHEISLDDTRRLIPIRLGKGNAPDQMVDWN